MFQSFIWNHLAAQILPQAPLVVFAQSDSGAALVPACGRRPTNSEAILGLLGDELFDYRDALACGDDDVLRRALAALEQFGAGVEERGLTPRAAKRWQLFGASLTPFCNAPCVSSATSADEFAARHTRSARLMRRLTRLGAEMRRYEGNSPQLVRAIYKGKAEQFQGSQHNIFAEPCRVEFMVRIAAQDPGCEIFTLETAGRLVSALVTFRDGKVRRFYTVYYDHAWAHHSPGAALLYEVSRLSLEAGLDCDYMTGEQPHKMRLATSVVPLLKLELSLSKFAETPDWQRQAA